MLVLAESELLVGRCIGGSAEGKKHVAACTIVAVVVVAAAAAAASTALTADRPRLQRHCFPLRFCFSADSARISAFRMHVGLLARKILGDL